MAISGRLRVQGVKEVQHERREAAATPIAHHFKLSKNQAPGSIQEAEEIENIPYANIIGSLMYAMICTRPNISHVVSITSRYMSAFGKEHWSALKWVLRHLKGVGNYGILYKGCDDSKEEAIQGYCDADYATNLDNRKSQTLILCFKLIFPQDS